MESLSKKSEYFVFIVNLFKSLAVYPAAISAAIIAPTDVPATLCHSKQLQDSQ